MADSNSNVFTATLRILDKASAPLRGAMEHVRGLGTVFKALVGETEREGNSLKEVGRELHQTGEAAKVAGHEIEHAAHHARGYEVLAGHVSLLRTHFGALSANLGEVGHNLSEFLPMLAGLGAAGGLVGLFEMTERAAEGFSQLQNSAKQAGMSTKQFAVFAEVAKTVDVPVARMSSRRWAA